jgi:hypothetical protein
LLYYDDVERRRIGGNQTGTRMTFDERVEAPRDLIELREPIPNAINRLRQFRAIDGSD